MVNADIRRRIFEAELTNKAVAAAAGWSQEHFCRTMAKELNAQQREKITAAIEKLLQNRTA